MSGMSRFDVEDARVVVLHKRAAFLVPPSVHDLAVDPIAFFRPPCHVGGATELLSHPDRPVHRDPGHQTAVGEVLAPAARLPDPSSSGSSQCSASQSIIMETSSHAS